MPTTRMNAARDAAIYERVYVRREIDSHQAAAEYGANAKRVSEILTEEHRRRFGTEREPVGDPAAHRRCHGADAVRPSLLQPLQPSERNLELYERVVVNREITAAQAARELGIGPQRVGQLLDKTHLCRHGKPRGSKAQQQVAAQRVAA